MLIILSLSPPVSLSVGSLRYSSISKVFERRKSLGAKAISPLGPLSPPQALLIPADVLVVSEDEARAWGSVEGTLLNEAISRGRVVAES